VRPFGSAGDGLALTAMARFASLAMLSPTDSSSIPSPATADFVSGTVSRPPLLEPSGLEAGQHREVLGDQLVKKFLTHHPFERRLTARGVLLPVFDSI
jgi:hypothetical protein